MKEYLVAGELEDLKGILLLKGFTHSCGCFKRFVVHHQRRNTSTTA